MRTQKRNRTPFYYALYTGVGELTDSDGLYTGEKGATYGTPVLYKKGNINPATGNTDTEQFGKLEDYDHVIVTADMSCPITEESILWVDEDDTDNPHDYIVKKIAKSKNGISIAIKKVKVS